MLPDDELAVDIRANGLLMPLIVGRVDGQIVLVDGRNRRFACQALGIVPHYIVLDGQDPIAYILSANINRRHMSKGQRAMAVAKIYPEPQKLKRKNSSSSVTKELPSERLSLARTVLRHAPDLADQVLNGSLSLDKAYEEARIRKGQADTYVDIRTFLSYSSWREREAIHQAAESPRCQDHQKTGQRGSRTRRACRASSADPDARR